MRGREGEGDYAADDEDVVLLRAKLLLHLLLRGARCEAHAEWENKVGRRLEVCTLEGGE